MGPELTAILIGLATALGGAAGKVLKSKALKAYKAENERLENELAERIDKCSTCRYKQAFEANETSAEMEAVGHDSTTD